MMPSLDECAAKRRTVRDRHGTVLQNAWIKYEVEAIAMFSYSGTNKTVADSFQVSDRLVVTERCKGWYRGSLVRSIPKEGQDDVVDGLFPCDYFVPLSRNEDLVILDLMNVYREWTQLLQNFYLDGQMEEFKKLHELLKSLKSWNSILKSPFLSGSAFTDMKAKVVKVIEDGRRELGLDTVVRTDSGQFATHITLPPAKLFLAHRMSDSSAFRDLDAAKAGQGLPHSPHTSSPKSTRSKRKVTQRGSGGSRMVKRGDRSELKLTVASGLGDVVAGNHALFIKYTAFVCKVGDAAKCYFGLYHSGRGEFIADWYSLPISSHGMADVSLDLVDKISFAYPGIGDLDMLYIVVRVFRQGKLVLGAKGKGGVEERYTRPFAVGVCKLPALEVDQEGKELALAVYQASDSSFLTMHEQLISKGERSFTVVPNSQGVMLSAALVDHISKVSEDATLVHPLYPLSESQRPAQWKSVNDMFITFEGGDFLTDKKKSNSNIEATVKVCDAKGTVLTDCLFDGSVAVSATTLPVLLHSGSPKWGAGIRLRITKHNANKIHLLVVFAAVAEGKKPDPFAYSFFPATNARGAVQRNGKQPVPVYKVVKGEGIEGGSYLQDGESKLAMKRNVKDVLNLNLRVIADSITQNEGLVMLLNWKSHVSDMAGILKRVTFVEPVELRRFIKEVFDAFFAMLDFAKSDPPLMSTVYQALMFVAGQFLDPRITTVSQEELDEVLARYLDRSFPVGEFAQAHRHLLACIQMGMENLEQQSPSDLMRIVKSLEFTMKFAVGSFRRAKEDSKGTLDNKRLKDDFRKFLDSFNQLMSVSDERLIGVRSQALKTFGLWSRELEEVFPPVELMSLYGKFLSSVPTGPEHKVLTMDKLFQIKAFLDGPLFDDAKVRDQLVPIVVNEVQALLQGGLSEIDDQVLCLETVIQLMVKIEALAPAIAIIQHKKVLVLLPLLFPMLVDVQASLMHGGKPMEHHGLAMVVICLLVWRGDAKTHMSWATPERLGILLCLLEDFVTKRACIPNTWLSVKMWVYAVIKKLCIVVVPVLIRQLDVGMPSKLPLWTSIFRLIVSFLSSPFLSLERYMPSKQQLIQDAYGDIRIEVVNATRPIWEKLGPTQTKLINHLAGLFLELIVIDEPAVRQLGISLYFDMLSMEFKQTRKFYQIEMQSVDTMDKIVNQYGGTVQSEFERFFVTKLHDMLATKQPEMKALGEQFISNIQGLISLLTALRTLPVGLEFNYERTTAILKLMSYLQQIGLTEKFFGYCNQLAELHKANGNYVEAANAFLLHANLLDFSDKEMEVTAGAMKETSYTRKVRLYQSAIDLYEKDKLYERAIALQDELREIYQHSTYDYMQLSGVLSKQAHLYKAIIEQERFWSEYFIVGYFGGFPDDHKNRQFIVRAAEFERMLDFQAKIQSRWSSAKIYNKTDYPGPEILQGSEQYLQIFQVKPSSEAEQEGREDVLGKLPAHVRKVKQHTDIKVFVYNRPQIRKKQKTDNEFASLWITREFYVVQHSFPGVERRSEVISKSTVELPPIQNAIEALKDKNMELVELRQRFEQVAEGVSVQPFSMVLKGVIDAAVNGGIKNYADAFFNQGYLQAHPEDKERVEALKGLLPEQSRILAEGLALHRGICGAGMMDFHETLEVAYVAMKQAIDGYL